MKIEKDNGHHLSFRRAVYPSRNIKKGEVFSNENIWSKRPGTGIPSKRIWEIYGKKASNDISKDVLISQNDIEDFV